MKITFYEYNSFIIESGGKIVAIDPAATFFYYLQFKSVIPKSIWPKVSHIFVTHGDPDHYWYTDKMAAVSGAPVIMNTSMVRNTPSGPRALGPRSRGITFDCKIPNAVLLNLGETRDVDGITVSAVKATHGPLKLKIGPFEKTEYPGPGERIGWGSMGLILTWNGRTLVNLADTLLEQEAWSLIRKPDVLMIPIGGGDIGNTMGVDEAIAAIESIQPKVVIPTHYNMRAFFTKHYGPADDEYFRTRVEKLGAKCFLMARGETRILD
jgi:L-ascorbate metabolism protein UlaG (beta-lactamase superfamily)